MNAASNIRGRASEFGRGFKAGLDLAFRFLLSIVIIGMIVGVIVIGAIGAGVVIAVAGVVMAVVFVIVFAIALTRR